ncbi:uracil-DNA glycosylase [Mycoplasmoides fastidiosum]|uniref:uracil-DNA glycosylase n=1 Tax=Mycoplasmoides fastidiosum TaxID=92758 RepID=A0ABU0LZU3_9BACT|nr:uracil-DNA glycosylase [Mycoplasmoides fastidiosum]MDQ0514219.1 uracil-DNA glycosylase [Mycoplasmoides fastidiosum]UUD37373.1 uracil-DNA glycosylase [Mycoplasmoides fastidiosum]
MANLIEFKQKLNNLISKLSPGWKQFFLNIKHEPWWQELISELARLYNAYDVVPPLDNLFHAFFLTPIEEMKVIILGQDPYPTPNVANGLAFWFAENTRTPASFQNIIEKLNQEFSTRITGYLDISNWAKQGVFLLNAALTTEINQPSKHQRIWNLFSKTLMKHCAHYHPNLIYVGWGKFAQNLINHVCTNPEQKIFSSHPSPLAAHISFFKVPIFTKINEILEQQNLKKIEWY